MTPPIPVTAPDGVEYPSYSAAARALGTTKQNVRHHMLKHGNLDLIGTGKNPVIWRGQEYPSQVAVAKAAGVKPHAVCNHLTRYGNLDLLGVGRGAHKSHGKHASKPVIIAGTLYPSRKAFALAVGVNPDTVQGWFRHGRTHLIMQAVIRAQERQRRAT